jgi:hypothetical protein
MRQPYAWTRYWSPREGTYALTNEGFLQEPYKKYNIGGKTLSDINETPALILLGEPGIGKTFALKAERESVATSIASRGEDMLWPDLQAVGSPEAFDRAVVNTPQFQRWLRGEAVLHLYLDALDECMLRVRTLGRLLTNALREGPAKRLWLRLTCRTAEWSNELENDLKQLIGGERVKAFELLPLTKADVARAVKANGIDEATFFDYVRRTGASALASRPVPLDFLIRCFRRGELPSTQIELYESGCLALCEEFEHRAETGLQRPLSSEQRLAIAKRVAAATIFSTRSVLLFGSDDLDVPKQAVRLNELTGDSERAGPLTVEVTETALRDSLDTGLFTSRGAKTLGWAHHTYEEYLAARCVSDSSLTPEQMLPLIVHPDDEQRKLTPQLHGVAAWLSALDRDIFEYVVQHEPESILLSDVVVERDEDREAVVAELLRRKRLQQLARIDIVEHPKFRKLAHVKIAEQLRPILVDTTEPVELRIFAAEMAKYTECSVLVPELTEIALDRTQFPTLRVDAAMAVERLGSEKERAALKPLLNGAAKTQQEKSLVRLAVRATWPHALSTEELFAFLGPNRKRVGTVDDDYILVDNIRRYLTDNDLLPALQWVLRRVRSSPEVPSFRLPGALPRLEEQIIMNAWNSDDELVAAALADIVVEKIRRWESLVSKDDRHQGNATDAHLMADATKRRRLATFLLPAVARSRLKVISPWRILEKTPYMQPDDVPWLIQRQASVPHTPEEAKLEANLILFLADLTDPSTLALVFDGAKHNSVLQERLEALCAPVALDSEEAREDREHYSEMQELSDRRKRDRAERAKPVRHVDEWITKSEQEPCAFWRLLQEMARTDDDGYANSMNLDVQTFPGWIETGDATRRQTIDLAERFVRECDSNAESWFGTQQVALSAMGGVRALTLLQAAAPQRFASLGPESGRNGRLLCSESPIMTPTSPCLRMPIAMLRMKSFEEFSSSFAQMMAGWSTNCPTFSMPDLPKPSWR